MSIFKRLVSLLLVCVVLFGAFSTVANASNEFDLSTLNWGVQFRAGSDNSFSNTTDIMRPLTHLIHFNFGIDNKFIEFPQQLRFNYSTSSTDFNDKVSTIIIPKGDGFSVSLNNIRDRIVFYDSNDSEVGSRYRVTFSPTAFNVILYSADGTYTIVTPDTFNTSMDGNRISYSFEIEQSPIDVVKFTVLLHEPTFPYGGSRPDSYSYWKRQITFDNLSSHTIKNIPEEKGFLKSIISWLSKLKDGITDIGTGISSMLSSLAELPSKIANFIIEGLKSLFIPDEQYIVGYKDKWDTLLGERFGVVYEIGGFAVDFAETIWNSMDGREIDYFDIPSVNLKFLNGDSMKIGGWRVNVRVSGLDWLYNIIQIAFGVAGTLLIVKGFRKRYDEVMGVET